MSAVPERLLSQLAHIELVNRDPEASARFFTEIVGLEESGRDGRSIYLRGWGERFHHSLVLTEGEDALGHIAWRAASPETLERAAERLKGGGFGEGWVEPVTGHGRAYRYRGPGGHLEEIFWDVERIRAGGELAPLFPHRPQRFRPRGMAARQLDHVTVATVDIFADAEFRRDVLGFRFTGWTGLPHAPDQVVFAQCSTNEQAHDLGLVPEMSDMRGRLNHLAFWVDQPQEVLRGADVLLDYGLPIEFGPGRHGMGEITYIYFREPARARVELNSGGYRNYEPDLETVHWIPAQGSNDWYRTSVMPESMGECFPAASDSRVDWENTTPYGAVQRA